MRWVGEALRGAWTALAAHPGVFASVTLAVAALNVVAPVAILSAVRKPLDFYTLNPWLKRLPEYLASDDAPLGEKLAKLPDLALFWVSAGSTYGGAEWGFAVDVSDVGRILLVSALFGLYLPSGAAIAIFPSAARSPCAEAELRAVRRHCSGSPPARAAS